jgi:predicted helicase
LVHGETNVQPLSDDYVKFLAFAFKTSMTAGSVVGLITNRSYLDGLIHRGVRQSLLTACSNIYLIDLHGDSNVGETPPDGQKNDNVFDIMQGVAISVFVRKEGLGIDRVHHQDVWGTRAAKYAVLARNAAKSIEENLTVVAPYFFFSPKNLGSQAEQIEWVSIQQLFTVGGMGLKSRRDHFLIAQNREVLRKRFAELVEADQVESLRRALRVTDNPQWSLGNMRELVCREGVDEGIHQITYRPFDMRFIWYHREAIERGDARWPVMKHVLPRGLSLLTSRQSANAEFSSVFVSRGLSEMKTAESTRGSYAFPLFLVDQDAFLAESPTTNLRMALLGNSLESRTPEEALYYIYAILHSPSYRSRYSAALRIEFPRIPPNCSKELVDELCRFGRELVSLHLMESPILEHATSKYVGTKNPVPTGVMWLDETVWLNAPSQRTQSVTSGTVGFEGVAEAVWKFHIGGYKVCEKWLKERKGRPLLDEEIAHYEKIILAVEETIRLMQEIDVVIDGHGGWPEAFAA